MSAAAWLDIVALVAGLTALLVMRWAQRRADRYFESERRRGDRLYARALIAIIREHEERERDKR